ncbi:MAG TPA: hypothetical protein VFQ39_16900, partial [Longimicrobium sp.]|nr:hypothetical protein [Longimicrobium sp.]
MPGPTDKTQRPAYSGSVVVRLHPGFADVPGKTLADDGARRRLPKLAALLREWKLTGTRRVVRAAAPAAIAKLEARAAESTLPPLRSLNAYWRIDARGQAERAEELVRQLLQLPEVEHAYRELAATDPVVNAADDTLSAGQTYLDPAPTGIDARWAWTQTAGDGAGIAVIDLEQGWIPTHEDLAAKSPTVIHGDNRHGVGTYVGDHGTAVLGEIAAVDNTRGVVGIAPAVGPVRMVSHFDLASGTTGHVADGIVAA